MWGGGVRERLAQGPLQEVYGHRASNPEPFGSDANGFIQGTKEAHDDVSGTGDETNGVTPPVGREPL